MSAGDVLLNATTEIAATVAGTILNATTPPPPFMVMATDSHTNLAAIADLNHVGDGIFLQSKTALGIAGAFVCVALFLTCQQVGYGAR